MRPLEVLRNGAKRDAGQRECNCLHGSLSSRRATRSQKNLDTFQLFRAALYLRRLVAELKALARHTSGESRPSTALVSPARYRRNSTAPSHVTRRGEGRHQQGGNP